MTPSGARDALVAIWLSDRNGAPVEGARIQGVLRRPTSARLDQPLVFKEIGRGEYGATISAPAEGQWSLHARAQRAGDHLDLQRTLLWRMPTP
jgi:nitrogen fixation protein FixH